MPSAETQTRLIYILYFGFWIEELFFGLTYLKDEGEKRFPVNFFPKMIMEHDDDYGADPRSEIENPRSFLLKAKILWLDIEMRCAGCAAAKVESYF